MPVGSSVGGNDGFCLYLFTHISQKAVGVNEMNGAAEGLVEGADVGMAVGTFVGVPDGRVVGSLDGVCVGFKLGCNKIVRPADG